MASMAPARAMRCPTSLLVLETGMLLAYSPKTSLIAMVSILSLTVVEVP